MLTSKDVARLLSLDFETGKLYWKERSPDMFRARKQSAENACAAWNGRYCGSEAFTADSHGYLQGRIYGRVYRAHRIVWLLAHGYWPTGQIDHINGDRTDNRLINLRQVSNAGNQKNTKRPINNTSGVVGVHWEIRRQKWMAYITINRQHVHLGYFNGFDEAAIARKAAEVKNGFHPNHGREI